MEERYIWNFKEIDNELMFEEYIGEIVIKDVLDAQKKILETKLDSFNPKKSIVFLNRASFSGISFGELKEVFSNLVEHQTLIRSGIVQAIVHGERSRDEVLKVSALSKYDMLVPYEIKSFVSAQDAYDWLELDEFQIKRIKGLVEKTN